jgi:predicted ABC-type sugar transport system permease subunit
MQSRNPDFPFSPNFDFGTQGLLTQLTQNMVPPFPVNVGEFLLLDGTDFLLLDGTNLNLL